MDSWKLEVLVFCVCLLQYTSAVPTEERIDCSKCVERLQNFVDYIQNDMALTDNVDPAQICGDVPTAFQQKCKEMLSSNDVSIILNIRHMTVFCKIIGQCEIRGRNDLVFEADIEPGLGSNVESSVPCMVCENTVQIVQDFLKVKEHRRLVYAWLIKSCRYLPFFKAECDCEDYMKQNGLIIINKIMQYLNPELCKFLHICPTNLANNKDSCRMCSASVDIIQDRLADPALENRLILAMDELCETFGNDGEIDLTRDMREYLPYVIMSLKEKAQWKHLCQDSGICSKADLPNYDSEESDETVLKWIAEEVEDF